MKELLNKLIEKGWKPSGKECSHFIKQYSPDVLDWKVIYTAVRKDEGVYNIHYTLRELVSKESGLWQFVCEKVMVKEHTSLDKEMRWRKYRPYDAERENKYMYNTYQYRLLESSLIDESKLEKFLLDNINV